MDILIVNISDNLYACVFVAWAGECSSAEHERVPFGDGGESRQLCLGWWHCSGQHWILLLQVSCFPQPAVWSWVVMCSCIYTTLCFRYEHHSCTSNIIPKKSNSNFICHIQLYRVQCATCEATLMQKCMESSITMISHLDCAQYLMHPPCVL